MHNCQSTYMRLHGTEEDALLGLEENGPLGLEEDTLLGLEENGPLGLEEDVLPGRNETSSLGLEEARGLEEAL